MSYLIRLPEVITRTGMSRSTILRMVNGQLFDFPMPVKLGARSVAWRSDEIDQWIAARPRSIDGGAHELS